METTTQHPILDLLKTHFGYEKFLPNQEEIINNLLDQKDTIAIMPTGGGKIIVFSITGPHFGRSCNRYFSTYCFDERSS